MSGILKHLLVAFVWVFLIGNMSLGGLLGGMIGGFLLLAIFRRALLCENYVRRVNGFLRYSVYFLTEVVKSNIRIAMISLKKNPAAYKGHYIHYNVQGMTKLEVLILSHCLNLTPGTIVAKHSHDTDTLAIHSFPTSETSGDFAGIDNMRARIMRFTR